MDKRHFGTMLRNLRRAHRLTQGDLADKLGLDSHAHISNLECGRKAPSLTLARRIAQFFEIPFDNLLPANRTDTRKSDNEHYSHPLVLREVAPPYSSALLPGTGQLLDFGSVLRLLRQQMGLSQSELAHHLGLASHSYLSYLERGQKKPSAELAERMANFFDVPIADLVQGLDEGVGTPGHLQGRPSLSIIQRDRETQER